MALELSINLCLESDCETLKFSETTGAYNALSNTTGWGAPNPTTGTATSATLVVTNPAGTQYTIDLLATTYFPTSNSSLEYTIPLSSIGNITSVTDGYWTFEYTVMIGTDEYTVILGKVFYCAKQCCLDNMLTKIKESDCDSCDDNYYTFEEYTRAKAYLDSLDNAATCGDTEYIEDILEILQKLCNKSGCKTCN